MCAKNHLVIFSSFLDIWENVEWPRFFGPPCMHRSPKLVARQTNYKHNTMKEKKEKKQLDKITDNTD